MAPPPRIAWLLNLDADIELQDPARYRAAVRADKLHALRARMADLVALDDIVLPASDVPPDTVVQCFCPTPSALAQLAQLGLAAPPAPALSVLRKVNDRAFCAELGQCLPHASFVTDMAALEEHLRTPSPTGRYVIKRAFSFAGREQRRVEHGALDASTRGFCQNSFARREGLQVEPWVERLGDFSRHGYLTQDGTLTIGPTREQRCDAHGRFAGMSPDAPQLSAAESETLAAELQRTAAALTTAGYFGPFGIDGFRYRAADGGSALDPRCEINARFTMGYPRALLMDALSR
jgi:hypothetical protein